MLSATFQHKINLDDLDFMQHVGHANWLLLFERSRVRLLESIGFSPSVMLDQGIGVVVSRALIEYRKQVLAGDMIEINVSAEQLSATSIQTKYIAEKKTGEEACVAQMTLVFIGNNGKPVRIPTPIVEKI